MKEKSIVNRNNKESHDQCFRLAFSLAQEKVSEDNTEEKPTLEKK